MKKQIKAIYDQCPTSENKKVESSGDEIQVEYEVYNGQGRGPWCCGSFHGNNTSGGVNIHNRNIGGSVSPNQAGKFVPREYYWSRWETNTVSFLWFHLSLASLVS